ncbi:unnamed protein product [Owenia fusiformis]|uniref:Poly [ADP-ribose] polymerase n=1 Tax=Owenia fusiformis TaxID=6347 RepID=A0A8S4PW39_OWEFU|nr:unnamed protein product [Owenia fusiformis]
MADITSTRMSGSELRKRICDRLSSDLLAADLQLSFLAAALSSYRFDTVLRPVPPMFDNGTDDKNYKGIELALGALSEYGTLKDLKQGLISQSTNNQTGPTNNQEETILKLIDWTINNKNVTVHTLEKSKFSEIKDLTKQSYHETPAPNYIFEVTYNDVLNAKFDELCNGKEMFYGYHGSRVENFHSILHYGLHSHMNKVALYGEGTYLSSELSVSMSYSPGGKAWESSLLGDTLSCVAVCQIIDHPSVKCQVKSSSEAGRSRSRSRASESIGGDVPDKYYVVQNNDALRLKYVLVYAQKSAPKRFKEVSWMYEHRFILIMGFYMLILLAVGLANSKTFQSFWRKWR